MPPVMDAQRYIFISKPRGMVQEKSIKRAKKPACHTTKKEWAARRRMDGRGASLNALRKA